MKSLCLVVVSVVCSWLLATTAAANTAAEENGGSKISGLNSKGSMRLVYDGLICSDYAAGDDNCTPFDLNQIGQGDVIVLHLYNDGNGFTCDGAGDCTQQSGGSDDCSGTPAFTFTTAPFKNTGSDASPTSARQIANDSVIDDSDDLERVISINTSNAPLDRYIFVTQTGTDTSCDDIDIAIYIYSRADAN